MSSIGNRQVARRQVFYLPGYDPFPPRRYRELYRREAAEQAAISGYDIEVCASADPAGWRAQTLIDGQETVANITVLRWSDIVQGSMAASIPQTYAALFQTAWIYIATGALPRLMRLRKGPIIAALYPVVALLLQLLLAVALGLVVMRLMLAVTSSDPGVRVLGGPPEWLPLGWAYLLGAIAAVLVLRWFKARDARFFVHYLMLDFAHAARHRGAYAPELEARLAAFGDKIAAALLSDVDEVLLVGHSSGAHLGISMLADLIRDGRVPFNGPALSFLSLGHVVPMVSFLPDAHRLRADLYFLSQRAELTWVDVSAPGDGCAFALCDPVAVSGVAPAAKRWPLVFSAAFTQTLSPERIRALRWRFFRLHFQYLCAFDRPKDYDYFQITAGPHTLGTRYAERPPSKSRITRATSKFTSRAA